MIYIETIERNLECTIQDISYDLTLILSSEMSKEERSYKCEELTIDDIIDNNENEITCFVKLFVNSYLEIYKEEIEIELMVAAEITRRQNNIDALLHNRDY